MASTHWPSELRLKEGGRVLTVAFEDVGFDLAAEYLRVVSPSAEVQGHSAAQRKTLGGKSGVSVARIEPIGHYAVKLVFSDGHDSGLYTWDYLYELGHTQDATWGAYLSDLARKGLSRDRPGQA